MCHRSTAANSQYTFHYLSLPHSYYMISSNGGSWSTIDTNKNNIVRAFKFGAGDVINCEVFFVKDSDDAGNKIIFKKGA